MPGTRSRIVCQVAELDRRRRDVALLRVREDDERVVGHAAEQPVDRAGHAAAEHLNRDDGGDADDQPGDRQQRAQLVAEQNARALLR